MLLPCTPRLLLPLLLTRRLLSFLPLLMPVPLLLPPPAGRQMSRTATPRVKATHTALVCRMSTAAAPSAAARRYRRYCPAR